MTSLVALLLALVGMVLVPTPANADDGDLAVVISDVSPSVLRTDDTLTVTGRLVNDTDEALDAPTVRLRMQQHVPATRAALLDWLDGSSDLNVVALTGANSQGEEIPAHGSIPFEIEIETTGTFGQYAAWGPRGIEIEAVAGGLQADVRTTLLWYPTEEPLETPAEVTMLAPLTPTAQEWRTAVEEEIPVGEAAAPRLLDVLDALGPEVSLAVDPVLLEDVTPTSVPVTETETDATGDPSEDTGDATTDPGDDATDGEDPPARDQAELIARLAQDDTRRDLIALGYADADLTALAAVSGGEDLWSDGVARGAALFDAAGLTVENVAWPAGSVSEGALSVLAGSGSEAVVLDADDVTAIEATNARASVDVGGTSMTALLADRQLGALLVDGSISGAVAEQAVLSLSAVMTRALPRTPTGVLVVLPREIGSGGAAGLDELSARVQALASAPWLDLTNLRSLLGRTNGGARLQIDAQPADDSGLDAATIRELLEGRDVVDAYAQAAGSAIRDDLEPALLIPLSATLGLDESLRTDLLTDAGTAIEALHGAIRVDEGSTLTLISDASEIPVTITNDLDTDATIHLQLVPRQAWLQAPDIPEYTIAAHSSETVRIPITAIANGDVVVDVRVTAAPGGPDLAEPTSFSVRVRADWENIGTAVVAGLLLIAFVVGLIRTIRRGGRRAGAAGA